MVSVEIEMAQPRHPGLKSFVTSKSMRLWLQSFDSWNGTEGPSPKCYPPGGWELVLAVGEYCFSPYGSLFGAP